MTITQTATFTNPVLPGFHPDPSICRVGDDFYLVVSSFEYFPGIPLFHSRDLVSWTPLGHVLDRPEQLDLSQAPASGGVFAPTIRWHRGVFYVTATNVSGRGHFIVSAVDPAGPWSDPVWVDQNGIDPSLFFEDDLVYFTSNVEPDPSGPHLVQAPFRRGIQQSLIDPGSGSVLTPPRFVWEGSGGRYPEGPHLYRRGDHYYLVISEGGTEYGHRVTVGRSTSPWGPFEASPYGPMVSHGSIASPLQAVGHADLIELDDDEWWMVCLGVRPRGQWPRHVLGRETLLAPVSWTDDGWPRVGEQSEVAVAPPRPSLPVHEVRPAPVRDDFDAETLHPSWQFLRRPVPLDVLLSRPGSLTLPTGAPLRDNRFPSFVGRRQQHHYFVSRALLESAPDGTGDEAGLVVWMNESHFFSLAVRRAGDASEVALRQVIGRIDLETVLQEVPLGPVVLEVRGDGDEYIFSATAADGSRTEETPLEARFLSTEFAGGFTGAFVGLFAASAGSATGVASFDWFEYEGQDPALGMTDPRPAGE